MDAAWTTYRSDQKEVIEDLLVSYGPLGLWVCVSIWERKNLVRRLDKNSVQFEEERRRWHRERTKWLTILGRKGVISDRTIMEVTENND